MKRRSIYIYGVINVNIIHAKTDDLNKIYEIESSSFPPSEAAKKEEIEQRLKLNSDYFWIAEENGKYTSFIHGYPTNEENLCDDMFHNQKYYDESGDRLMLLSVATHPDYRGRGCASLVMESVINDWRRNGRKEMVLTCKDKLIPFYSRFGFINEGKSQSCHGGAVWYQMRLTL